MFISKDVINDIVDDGVELLSMHPAFVDIDDDTWDEVKEVWKTIMRRNFHSSSQQHNELKRAGIARAKEKGVFKGRQSRFSDEEFAQMREEYDDLHNQPNMNKTDLAAKWGITRSYLYQICRKQDDETVA